MLEAIPVLSGSIQVFDERGSLCVAAPWCTIDDVFQVQDLRHEESLAYQTLREKQFPLEDIEKGTLPPLGRSWGFNNALILSDGKRSERPVMFVQVNVVKGGIILAQGLHHSFTDGNGVPTIMKVWAAYCRGDDGLQLITQAMLDRERLMQGWGSASLIDIPELGMKMNEEKASASGNPTNIRRPTSTKNLEGHVRPEFEHAIFFFLKSKLVELKDLASVTEHGKDGDRWISTIDALSSLLGCCIASARDKETRTRADMGWVISSVLGGRRLLDPPLPAGYIGNVLSHIRVTAPNQNIDSTPAKVAEIAHLIRDQIKQRGEPYFRGIIAALSSVEDLTKIIVAPVSPSEDRLKITSWAPQDVYDINWGNVVGPRIERVRRMRLGVPFMCWIMPELKAPCFVDDECGLEVLVGGLEREQMAQLKQNELFMRFAQWRCN